MMPRGGEPEAAPVATLVDRAAASGIPLSGAFELTSRCNLACRMCYIRHGAGDERARHQELSARQWVALAEEAAQAGMLFLLLTGGEVLLRPDFLDIYTPLTEMGLHLTIYANGTLINPKIARALADHRPHRVGITLYGASPETYAAVTGSGEAFSRALQGIDLLLDARVPVVIRTTLTRRNVHDHEAIKAIAHERGLPLISAWLLTCRPDGKPSQAREERLTPAEVVALEAADEESREQWRTAVADPGLGSQGTMYCQAGRSTFVIGPSGEMNPCMDLPVVGARPVEVGFEAAWRHVQAFVGEVPRRQQCQECSVSAYCGACPASPYLETGSFQGAAPYECAIARERARVFGQGAPCEELPE